MLRMIARIVVFLVLAVMIAAWALSAGKSERPQQRNHQKTWRMYS
jgi:uncharacterized membrane protein YqjE